MTHLFNDMREAVRIAFCELHRIQFAAPWLPVEPRCR